MLARQGVSTKSAWELEEAEEAGEVKESEQRGPDSCRLEKVLSFDFSGLEAFLIAGVSIRKR